MAADGEVDFYATIARDMTRERAAEAALRESEERFRIAFEQAPIGVSLLDLDGQLRAGQRRLLRDRPALARGAHAARPGRRSRTPTTSRSRATRWSCSSPARCRCSASRSATSTPPATRSGWRSAAASSATPTDSPQYLIGMVQDLGERRVAHTLQRSMLTTQLPRGRRRRARRALPARYAPDRGQRRLVRRHPAARRARRRRHRRRRRARDRGRRDDEPAAHGAARLRGRGARARRRRREAAPARRPPARRA